MRACVACGAACLLGILSLACCSLALQLDVAETLERRHEPRPPVWPGQYQVRQLSYGCQ